MPEITEASKHIMLEETKQGLNIEIVDQDGRSMFPDGAKEPNERTRKIIQKIAPPAQGDAVPSLHRRSHGFKQSAAEARLWAMGTCPPTAPMRCARYWKPKACRPATSSWWPENPTRSRLFPDDPYMSPNRRVTITLMREEPPLPADLTP